MNICYSGGAKGSDLAWGELALCLGHDLCHFSFDGHQEKIANRVVLTFDELSSAQEHLTRASKTMKRNPFPKSPFVRNLLRRNWFQVKDSDSVYAISTIKDGLVQGGTGWAVQMAIDRRVPWIFCFDQIENEWFRWMYEGPRWMHAIPKKPVGKWTGIGTREINSNGLAAISNVSTMGW